MSRNSNNDTSLGDAFMLRRNAARTAPAAPPPPPLQKHQQQQPSNGGTPRAPLGRPPSFAEIQAEQQQQSQERRRPPPPPSSQREQRGSDHEQQQRFGGGGESQQRRGGSDRDQQSQQRRGGDRDQQQQQQRRGGGGGGRRGSQDRSNLPIEQGVVCALKDSFGFIYCADREEELFFHFSEMQNCHPDDLIMDDELEFRVGSARGDDKMAAYQLYRLDRGTIVFETEDEPGVRFQGVVEKPLRTDRSGNVTQDGVIRMLMKQAADGDEDDAPQKEEEVVVATTGAMVRFTPHDYVPDPTDQQEKQEADGGGGGRFRRTSSTTSSSSRGGFNSRNSNGLGSNDLVEFTLVTSRRNQTKYARSIKLLQSDRERQRVLKEEKMLESATVERGIVTTLKSDFGFLRSNKRREEVYFHYTNVELDDDDGDEADDAEDYDLKVGNAMEFLVVTEEGANGRKEKISARKVKFLPHGSVHFQTILAQGVTGIVTRCPHPADAGFTSDMVGAVTLTKSIKDKDGDGNERDVEEISFYSADSPGGIFSVRDGAVGLWVREGDTLLFDVAKETIDGSLRVFPTKTQVAEEEEAESPAVKLVACGFALRTEGTVHALKDQFGFIQCAERPVDSYFRFYEQFPKELHNDLLRGMGMKEIPQVSLEIGTEVQFDLSIQRLTGQARQRNQRGGAALETLKCQRVLVLPKGTLVQNKIIAKNIKGVIEKEDPKQPYAGSIELEEERKSMNFDERHPLVAKLIQSLLESSDSKSFVFPDIQSVKEDEVVMEAAETLGKGLLQCTHLPVAGQSNKNGGRLCIVRDGEEANSHVAAADYQAGEKQIKGENDEIVAPVGDGEPSDSLDKKNETPSKKKGRKKKKPKSKIVKSVRYDKHSLATEFQDGIPPAVGDQIICDVVQSRRTGLVQITNLRIIERKDPDAGAEATESTETGVGMVSEIVSARQFGFISILDEGAMKREVLFFHFKNVVQNGARGDDNKSKGAKGAGIRKGDEAKFFIATQAGGKRTATKIEILTPGTLGISSKAAMNACSGFVLMEPSHSSLKDTPDRHGRSRPSSPSPMRRDGGISPKRGAAVSPKRGAEGGRWGRIDLNEGKTRNKMAKEGGRILLTDDPSSMFAAQQQKKVEHMSSVDSDAIDEKILEHKAQADAPECAICTHVAYKSGAIAIHGAGSTSVADSSSKGPRRGDLVSFVKDKNGRGARDVRVVIKGAATLIRGRLEQIVVKRDSSSMGTAVFIAATEKEEAYTIELKEIVSCEVSVIKENEAVEGLLHEQRIFGVCRTKDLFLESKLGLSHKERPKLNLTVRKGLGGKIMAQTMMAKGPDGSNGFANGWTTRASTYVAKPPAEAPAESN